MRKLITNRSAQRPAHGAIERGLIYHTHTRKRDGAELSLTGRKDETLTALQDARRRGEAIWQREDEGAGHVAREVTRLSSLGVTIGVILQEYEDAGTVTGTTRLGRYLLLEDWHFGPLAQTALGADMLVGTAQPKLWTSFAPFVRTGMITGPHMVKIHDSAKTTFADDLRAHIDAIRAKIEADALAAADAAALTGDLLEGGAA